MEENEKRALVESHLISPDRFGGLYASDPRMDSVPGVWRVTFGSRPCVFYHWDRFMGIGVGWKTTPLRSTDLRNFRFSGFGSNGSLSSICFSLR